MLPLGQTRLLVGVFDGHGENGHVIATTTRDIFGKIATEILNPIDDGMAPLGGREARVPEALSRLFSVAQEHLERGGFAEWSGTTATVALIDSATWSITSAHVGDSRLVVANNPNGVCFETADHRIDGIAERRIIANGGDVREMTVSGVSAKRVFMQGYHLPGLSMSRALGDTQVHSVGVLSEPSIHTSIEFAPGSVLVVASDGIWEKVGTHDAVVNALSSEGDPDAAAVGLVVDARSRWLRCGGDVDDITAVVVHAVPNVDLNGTSL